MTGECARCLEPVSQPVEVRAQELFAYSADDGAGDADGYSLHGDLLDLEPALHDALVLALPLAPLCREDCPGLCVECGVPLAQAGPGHGHGPAIDPRWAGLQQAASRPGGLGEQWPGHCRTADPSQVRRHERERPAGSLRGRTGRLSSELKES